MQSNCGSNNRGQHNWGSRRNYNGQWMCRTRKKRAVALDVLKESHEIMEGLQSASGVMMGGCRTSEIWGFPGWNAWSSNCRFLYPITIRHPKLVIVAKAPTLQQVLNLLLLEVIFLWDMKTMLMFSASTQPTVTYSSSQFPTWLIWN